MRSNLFFGIVLYLTTSYVLYFTSGAQNVQYRNNYLQKWTAELALQDSIDQQFIHEDALMLYDFNSWRINDQQQTTVYYKNCRIKFLNEVGIKKHSTLSIPESIDPLREYSDLSLQKAAKTYRPKYFDLTITYFNARIIKPDGRVINTTPSSDSISVETLLFNSNKRFAYAYHFLFTDKLAAGDVLEIEYQYHLPYIFDWRRLFFHGKMGKQQYELQLHFPGREYHIFDFANGATPTDSVQSDKRPYPKTLIWRYQNLAPCLNEIGAKIHLDLPHIRYYIHNKAFGDWQFDRISNFKPYTWEYFAYNLVGFKKDNELRSRRRLSSKEIALNDFYKKNTLNIANDAELKKLLSIHNLLNNDYTFTYFDDHFANTDARLGKITSNYREKLLKEINQQQLYQGIFDRLSDVYYTDINTQEFTGTPETRLEKVPNALKNKTLNNLNSRGIYEGILNRMHTPYYKVSIADKRIDHIEPETCMPIFGENKLYSVQADNHFFYVYPKTQRFGYTLNELPFYLEGSTSIHIAQMTDSFFNKNNIQFFTTPISDATDNYRTHNIQVTINLQEKTSQFDAKIQLAGQYSTLTRQYYQYGTVDSSVNQAYYQNFDLHNTPTAKKTVQLLTKPKTDFDYQYPFIANVNLSYERKNCLSQKNDSTYTIDMSHWISHVIYNNLTTNKRYLPFYSDFEGRDVYRYALNFDQKVSLPTFKDLPLIIDNDFGRYTFTLEQVNDNTVLVVSTFILKTTTVAPENIQQVETIYQAIKQTQKAQFEVYTHN